MRAPVSVGTFVILGFFVVLGSWSAIAELSSAAIASGEVAVDSSRKTIQHFEGGIVKSILVRDGSIVEAGQLLIQLSETQALAQMEQMEARLRATTAREARLLSERDNLEEIAFPQWLLDLDRDAKMSSVIQGEINIFEARNASMASHAAILNRRIAQYREEIEGLNGEVAAADQQLVLLQEEIDGMESLVEKKMVGKSQLLALQREAADISGEKSRDQGLIARVRQNIAEQELQILELESRQSGEVVAELRDVQTAIFELQEQSRAAKDVLLRTDIVAPIAGTVVDLQVHTVGGVIASRQPLMDIVPTNDKLVINARLSTQDIDVIRVGLDAQIRLLAFNQRDTSPINGRVSLVSADRLNDERTGLPYYLAKIEFPDDLDEQMGGLELYPGMQAEVMIITGQRTALGYLMEPLSRSIRRSFREN